MQRPGRCCWLIRMQCPAWQCIAKDMYLFRLDRIVSLLRACGELGGHGRSMALCDFSSTRLIRNSRDGQ